jgi:hypothetical protein
VCDVGFPDLTSFMGPDVASVVLEQKAALGFLECLVRCVARWSTISSTARWARSFT